MASSSKYVVMFLIYWCRTQTDSNFACGFPALGLVWQVTRSHQQAQQQGVVGTAFWIVSIWKAHKTHRSALTAFQALLLPFISEENHTIPKQKCFKLIA